MAPKCRGRPQIVCSEQTMHHNYSNGSPSTSATDKSSEGQRYRRMRYLNNLASQRCRRKRNDVTKAVLEELAKLEARNTKLEAKVEQMEEAIKHLKVKLLLKGYCIQYQPTH